MGQTLDPILVLDPVVGKHEVKVHPVVTQNDQVLLFVTLVESELLVHPYP